MNNKSSFIVVEGENERPCEIKIETYGYKYPDFEYKRTFVALQEVIKELQNEIEDLKRAVHNIESEHD